MGNQPLYFHQMMIQVAAPRVILALAGSAWQGSPSDGSAVVGLRRHTLKEPRGQGAVVGMKARGHGAS